MKKQEYNPQYYEKNRQKIIGNQQEYNKKNKKKILEYMKKRFQLLKDNPEFKDKRKEWNAKWRKNNAEKIKANAREYYLKHKKTINLYKKRPKYIQRERERGKQRRQTKCYKIYRNNYDKMHPEKSHRIIIGNIIHAFTGEQWLQKVKDTNGICPKCKINIGIDKITLDHIYPISKANKDFFETGIKRIYAIDDVQPICSSCNSSKGDRV
jgi:5-methylcytosine-specific restriction endonuclease McrA